MAYTTIDDPSAYFQTKLYTGNDSSRAITFDGNTNMQPDWSWFKARSEAYNHAAFDSVRGVQKLIRPNQTTAEETHSTTLTAFSSNGFSLGGGDAFTNANSVTYASWHWKKTATAGFDIVSYTGNGSARTISHSLSAIPKMIIIKNRDDTDSWRVYHASTGNGGSLMLNLTNAFASDSTMWNNTSPTSSVFSLGDHDNVNGNGHKFIAYCFAEKKGYSKFGSYTGNGNADGTFFYTGFKPAFIIQKRSDATHDWQLHDNKRGQYFPGNVVNNRIQPNSNSAEGTGDDIGYDFLSNGFKTRTSNANYNASGSVYIYMAFAENPFVTSTGIPATAR